MDLFDKCQEFTRAEEYQAQDLYPYFTPIQEAHGNEIKVKGRPMIMVGSNNYLGLADHPAAKEAAKKAVDRYGVGTCGSRFLTGTIDLHEELESRLAKFMKREAAVTFSTGMQTNFGIITTIAGKGDAIIGDRMNHASIIDACRLSFADVYKYKHNDMKDLERVLRLARPRHRQAHRRRRRLQHGRRHRRPAGDRPAGQRNTAPGSWSTTPTPSASWARTAAARPSTSASRSEVDLVMGTFSKTFASIGGVAVGEAKVISYIKHHARSLIFSAAATPASVASVLAILEILETQPELRTRLWEITTRMRTSFQAMGYNTGPSQTPIIPIMIGDDEKGFMLWKLLRDEGIFTTPIIYPAVPHGQALIRTSYGASHTDQELDAILAAFEKCGKMLGII